MSVRSEFNHSGEIVMALKFVVPIANRITPRGILLSDRQTRIHLHAARRTAACRRLSCGASFFFALKTRHWTVPIGISCAAAIS